jgi:hypothetical protein
MDIESSPRKILDLFRIEYSIRHEYYLPFVTHDFGIVEVDFFDDSFDAFDTYGFADFEGFTHDNRKTSEEIGDDIFAREGKYDSSDTRTSQESTRVDPDLFESDKASDDPDTKKCYKSDSGKKFSHHQMFHRKIVLNLMKNKAYDVGNHQNHEKVPKYDKSMIEVYESGGIMCENI